MTNFSFVSFISYVSYSLFSLRFYKPRFPNIYFLTGRETFTLPPSSISISKTSVWV
jgi:hypothetical protein